LKKFGEEEQKGENKKGRGKAQGTKKK